MLEDHPEGFLVEVLLEELELVLFNIVERWSRLDTAKVAVEVALDDQLVADEAMKDLVLIVAHLGRRRQNRVIKESISRMLPGLND